MVGIAALLHKTRDAVKRHDTEKRKYSTRCGILIAETYKRKRALASL